MDVSFEGPIRNTFLQALPNNYHTLHFTDMKLFIQTGILSSMLILSTYYLSASYLKSNYIDSDNYSIRFSTKKADGTFSGLRGVIYFSEEDIENAFIEVSVDVSSIRTGNKTKDKHARNEKWFNAAAYPMIKFTSDSIVNAASQFKVYGTWQIKDVSQKQSINFSTEILDGETYLVGTTVLNRKEFNIHGNRIGFLVGKDVSVEIRVPSQFDSTDR